MDNVSEVVLLLRKQADLELTIQNGDRSAVATEQELEATRWRFFFAHARALNSVLQTARSLRRTPDSVSMRGVAGFR